MYDIYIDAVQVTKTAYPLPYRDGDMPGCQWDGTPHASTTTVNASYLVYDQQQPLSAGSISLWMRFDEADASIPDYSRLFAYGMSTAAPSNDFLGILVYSDGRLYASLKSVNGDNIIIYITNNVSEAFDGIWHQLTITWSVGDYFIGYFDGAAVATSTDIVYGLAGDIPQQFALGANIDGTAHIHGVDISDFFITNYAMSAAEIKRIYDSSVPIETPTANHELSVAGNSGVLVINENGLESDMDIVVNDASSALQNSISPFMYEIKYPTGYRRVYSKRLDTILSTVPVLAEISYSANAQALLTVSYSAYGDNSFYKACVSIRWVSGTPSIVGTTVLHTNGTPGISYVISGSSVQIQSSTAIGNTNETLTIEIDTIRDLTVVF